MHKMHNPLFLGDGLTLIAGRRICVRMKPLDFEQRARDEAEGAIAVLAQLTKSNDKNVALAACKELLNRAYGRSARTERDPFNDEFEGVDIATILGDKKDGR